MNPKFLPEFASLSRTIQEAIGVKQRCLDDRELISTLQKMIRELCERLEQGGQILIAGNGGSAADAQHFAAELIGRFEKERLPLPALALTTDTSVLTAIGNDYHFNQIFERQVRALGRPGDVFFAYSTSGESENILQAANASRQLGLMVMSFLGKGGGRIKAISDLAIVIPSQRTARIQECHLMLMHLICEHLENYFFHLKAHHTARIPIPR